MTNSIIETQRLILRQWQKSDYSGFANLNASPEVMQYFPSTLSRSQSDKLLQKLEAFIEANGWGFWAVELKTSRSFIGFIGINRLTTGIPCSPCVEIGWRLAEHYWRNGYASEGARASLQYAFDELKLSEVISITPKLNHKSRRVMRRIGMTNSKHNFNHALIHAEHQLSEHVLYKISFENWRALI